MDYPYIDIPWLKYEIVKDKEQRIKELFGYNICLGQKVVDKVRIHILEPENFATLSNEVKSNHIKKAKDYIRSATGIGDDHCTCVEVYEPHVVSSILTSHDAIELESQALLTFMADGRTVLISGQALNVANAKTQMEHHRRAMPAAALTSSEMPTVRSSSYSHLSVAAASLYCAQGAQPGREIIANSAIAMIKDPLKHTLSPGGESNHDSCYDSDNSPQSSRRNSSYMDPDVHSDVSRTTSDTLGTELEKDDVKRTFSNEIQRNISHLNTESITTNSRSAENLTSGVNTPFTVSGVSSDYETKVEFGIKLGYTEEQIGPVLHRLGIDVDQNELLGELIKAGRLDDASSPGSKTSPFSGYQDLTRSREKLVQSQGLPPLERKSSGGGSVMSSGLSPQQQKQSSLRPIVIDGSNVAMSHGNKEVFSCRGIQLAVDWFRQRGHQEIRVLVPQWRKEASRIDSPIKDQEILYELEKEQILIFTPARRVGGKRVVCYDDRYILKIAAEEDAVVVSNDNYRDLLNERPEFKKVVETRLLMYSFVHGAHGKIDRFMPPDDPLGRYGPTLDEFLRKTPAPAPKGTATLTGSESMPQVCPYAKKCTYGNKCKYYHPERGAVPLKSVTENLKEQASKRLQEAKQKGLLTPTNSLGDGLRQPHKKPLGKTKSLSVGAPQKKGLHRTSSVNPNHPDLHRQGSAASRTQLSRSHSPNLLVTSPNGEAERYDMLESRGGVGGVGVAVGAGVNFGPGSNFSSPRRTPSPVEQQQQFQQQVRVAGGNLIGGADWTNSGSALDNRQFLRLPPQGYVGSHETLRSVLSDPTSSYYAQHAGGSQRVFNQSVEDVNVLLRRQLALQQQQQRLSQEEISTQISKAVSIGDFKSASMEEKSTHKPLHRQLSLKGAEDPRINPQGKQPVSQQHSSGSNKSKPIVTFHGAQMPVGDRRQQAPVNNWYPNAQQMLLMSGNAAASGVAAQGPARDENLHRNVLLKTSTQNAVAMAALYNDDMKVLQVQQQQQALFEDMSSRHVPVSRMSSAPGAFGANPKAEPILPAKPAPMKRQNSTSDSNLTSQAMHSLFGDPRWSFSGSIGGQAFEPEQQYPSASPSAPALNLPGIKVAFGESKPNKLTLDVNKQAPGEIEVGRMTPGAPAKSALSRFEAPQEVSDDLTGGCLDTSQVYGGAMGLQQTVLSSTADALEIEQAKLLRQHEELELKKQQVRQQQIQLHQQKQLIEQQQQYPPHPETDNMAAQMGDNGEDMPIHKSDPRYQMYFHLCGLFDEGNVRRVMNSYPNEKDAKVLCAHLCASMLPK